MHSQTWTPLPPPSPEHLSGSSPCTSELNRQSMSDAGCSMLGAGAWGWPRKMFWGGWWEGGSCLGMQVRIKDFKIKKIKIKKIKKNKFKKKNTRCSNPILKKKKVLIKLLPASFISWIRLSKFKRCISHCW